MFDLKTLNVHRKRSNTTLSATDYLLEVSVCSLKRRIALLKSPPHKLLLLGRWTERMLLLLLDVLPKAQSILVQMAPPLKSLDPRCTFFSEPLENLPNRAEKFDGILWNFDLHWNNTPLESLQSVKTLLNPKGVFLCSLLGEETLRELREALLAAEISTQGKASPRISPFMPTQTLTSLMHQAGFMDAVITQNRQQVTYGSVYRLMKDLQQMGESNALERRSKFFTPRAVFQETALFYAQRFPAPGNTPGILATFDFLYGTGWG